MVFSRIAHEFINILSQFMNDCIEWILYAMTILTIILYKIYPFRFG